MRKKSNLKWVVSVTLASMSASVGFTFLSSGPLGEASYAVAFLFLFVFILLGVMFDMIGVAVTASPPGPLHSMAARRERGALEAIALIKNAEKVSSVCNDVVGDIAGIISGATSAIVASRLMARLSTESVLIQLLISAAVTGLTIGGKALGKTTAMNNSTAIVIRTGKVIHLFYRLFGLHNTAKRKK